MWRCMLSTSCGPIENFPLTSIISFSEVCLSRTSDFARRSISLTGGQKKMHDQSAGEITVFLSLGNFSQFFFETILRRLIRQYLSWQLIAPILNTLDGSRVYFSDRFSFWDKPPNQTVMTFVGSSFP